MWGGLALVLLVGCGRLWFDAADVRDAADPERPDAPMRPDGGLAAGVWYQTTPLVRPTSMSCGVVFEGHVYVIGGFDGTQDLAATDISRINSDGTLSPWVAGPALPVPSRWHACAVEPASRTVYVVGGDGGNTARTESYRATVAADGSLGPWLQERPLPDGRRGHGAFIRGGLLHVLGGEVRNGFALEATVFTALIASDGALGAWTMATPLPAADYVFGTALAGTQVIVTGGYASGAGVRTASSGGAFTATTPMPEPRQRHGTTVVNDAVYVIGGVQAFGAPSLDTVWRAPVQQMAVGAWESLAPLPRALRFATVVTDDTRLYVLGGANDAQTTETWVFVPP